MSRRAAAAGRRLLGSSSDPFLKTPASQYPRCLMPNGQQWLTPLPECSTIRARPALRAGRPRLPAGRPRATP